MNKRSTPSTLSTLPTSIPASLGVGQAVLLWRLGSDELAIQPGADPSTGLPTADHVRVETYFPPGTGVLVVRRDNDQVELQLGVVDKAGCFTPVRQKPGYPKEPGPADLHAKDREPVQCARFQSFTMYQGSAGLRERLVQIVGRLFGQRLGKWLARQFNLRERVREHVIGNVKFRRVHGQDPDSMFSTVNL